MARRDIVNNPEKNGEYWLLQEVLKSNFSSPIILDIGANKGDWTDYARRLILNGENSGRGGGIVYAFEPTASTYKYLVERFQGSEIVKAFRIALSSHSETKEFFVISEFAGVNTLTKTPGASVESVEALTVDDFLKQQNIKGVTLVKSDTEGHDFNVLKGAEQILASGAVEVWQFEYNHRWIEQGCFLKNVFNLIVGKPYILGKLFANGIECYRQWHPELERFIEGNYVLIKKGGPIEKFCKGVDFDSRNVPVLTE